MAARAPSTSGGRATKKSYQWLAAASMAAKIPRSTTRQMLGSRKRPVARANSRKHSSASSVVPASTNAAPGRMATANTLASTSHERNRSRSSPASRSLTRERSRRMVAPLASSNPPAKQTKTTVAGSSKACCQPKRRSKAVMGGASGPGLRPRCADAGHT